MGSEESCGMSKSRKVRSKQRFEQMERGTRGMKQLRETATSTRSKKGRESD
jgi:hypothetical protein